ncbi:hypothetical protein AB0I30_07315 [Nocardia tengchongensis]|uniref:hypothetical protein n=1 Tax=Nocardia tengchongensis TaxID=2055889 RepID=UPI0034057F98
MNGHVQLRLSGELGDITVVLASILASKEFRIVVDEKPVPDRHGFGVRVYVDLEFPVRQDTPPAEQQQPGEQS